MAAFLPPAAPLYAPPPDSLSAAAYPRQGMRQYTAGANATLAPGRWTVALLAGVDGYRLSHVAESTGPFPASVDPTLRSGTGAGDRATLRASGSTRLLESANATADLNVALEHAMLRQQSSVATPHAAPPGDWPSADTQRMVSWRHDTGLMAQASGAWRNTLFATAGLRVERNDALAGIGELSTLPMLGAAWVRALGPAELKLRAAYGRGIRPPSVPARESMRVGERGFLGMQLEPEVQTGFELGAELYLERRLSLQLTRFDQRATGLIQDVVVALDSVSRDGHPEQHVRYMPQNVGAVTNRGWEMQATARRGPLSLSGAFSLVDSRVRAVAAGYGGDLRPGDRMLAVPGRTAGLTAEWAGARWTGAVTASRAWDWINYDRLALAGAFSAQNADWHRFSGDSLRAFWRHYDGSTSVRATATRQVTPSVWLVVTGDNLLGGQLGEPDNLTIRPGRTMTVGIRTSF